MVTAALGVQQLRDGKKVLLSVPGGHGKSIIASFAATICINTPGCTKVQMVYPNKYLMERDMKAHEEASAVMHCGKVVFLTID